MKVGLARVSAPAGSEWRRSPVEGPPPASRKTHEVLHRGERGHERLDVDVKVVRELRAAVDRLEDPAVERDRGAHAAGDARHDGRHDRGRGEQDSAEAGALDLLDERKVARAGWGERSVLCEVGRRAAGCEGVRGAGDALHAAV